MPPRGNVQAVKCHIGDSRKEDGCQGLCFGLSDEMTKRAARIFEIMEQRGISEAMLCRDYGFKHSTVNGWKNDNKDPRSDQIEKFCRAVGISLSDFYSGEEFPKPENTLEDERIFDRYVAMIRRNHKQRVAIPFLKYVVDT